MNGQFPEFGSGSLTCIIFPPSPLETCTHRRSFSSSAARERNVGSLNFDLDLCWATRNRRDPLRLVIFAYMPANLNAAARSVRSAQRSDATLRSPGYWPVERIAALVCRTAYEFEHTFVSFLYISVVS